MSALGPGEARTLDSTVVQEYAYVYNGGTLMQMVIETTVDDGAPVTESLSFSYDASGMPISVVYNGTAYFYTVNLQGDVMAIVDASGTVVVSYAYDAWGNILSVTGTMADTLGESNPLTYRGYVYDHETQLYYLESRYYNPEWGRFLNADALVATGQGLLGNNMFAYCLNNPVNFVDSSGNNAEAVQWWATVMGWLPFTDTVLPIGDIIYLGGILFLGAVASASDQDYVPEISYDEADVSHGPPSPNDDDDDDDYDDYYNDDSNFGGRKKMGQPKENTPRNNKAQNKQFRDATRGLTKDQKQLVHHIVTGGDYGYHDIVGIAKDIVVFVLVCLL